MVVSRTKEMIIHRAAMTKTAGMKKVAMIKSAMTKTAGTIKAAMTKTAMTKTAGIINTVGTAKVEFMGMKSLSTRKMAEKITAMNHQP